MKFPWKKEEATSTSEEGVTVKLDDEGEPPKKPESTSVTPPTDTGVEGPFSGGPLAGQTAQEAADLIALQALTIKEQTAAASVEPTAQPTPEPIAPPIEVTSEAFFQDPGKATRDIVSQAIQTEMKEIVSELRADMAVGRSRDAWDEAADAIPNLASMRPLIEAKLKQNGVQAPNLASIIAVNDMLVGQAARQGQVLPGSETKTEPVPTPENTRVIPQHSVSTQPLAPTGKAEEAFEPLDENEARMAREKKMTHAQFRQWGALDIEDVLAPATEAK